MVPVVASHVLSEKNVIDACLGFTILLEDVYVSAILLYLEIFERYR